MKVFDIFFLLILFLLIGKSAEIVVSGTRVLIQDLRIPPLISGIVLGFFTTLPEFFVGITSTIFHANEISFGNTMGGIIVLFGLISGLYIIFNDDVRFEHPFTLTEVMVIMVYFLLPFVFIISGSQITPFEGLLILVFYMILLFWFFQRSIRESTLSLQLLPHHKKTILSVVFGILGLVVFSRFIVTAALRIVEHFSVTLFLLGAIVFSIGTNLPEIVIAFRSWKKKILSLPVGTIIGSALSNILIVGIIALFRSVEVRLNASFFNLLIFFIFISIMFFLLAMTGGRFRRKEGAALLGMYIFYIITQIFLS